MTREEAIEKIKKLQALKEGAAKVSSDGESAQAAKIIDKLQKQFGITMEEVYSYTPAEEEPDADSGQNYDYTGEDKELATKEVQTKLEDGYVDIINKYSYLQDSSLRIQKTLADFDMYGAEVLDDEELMERQRVSSWDSPLLSPTGMLERLHEEGLEWFSEIEPWEEA